MKRIFLFSIFLILTIYSNIEAVNRSDKQRIIVTTDLGGSDPDDIQSFIHLILEVTDSGLPTLTSYRRIVLEIK